MTVAFSELEGSPTIAINSAGTQATRMFRVAWDDWPAFAQALTGGWRRVGDQYKLVEPLPFPGLPAVVIEEVRVEPLDAGNPEGDQVQSIIAGLNRYPAAGAKVTVRYANRPNQDSGSGGEAKIEIRPGTILTYRSELGAEYFSTPGRTWNWNVAGDPKLPEDVHPGILMPTGNYTLKWDRVANPPWSAIRSLRGKVNNAAFYNADAETVLFLGARADRQFEFLANASLWSVEYAFAERSVSWNKLFRAETQTWTEIEDGGGNKPYATGDFTALFQFGA